MAKSKITGLPQPRTVTARARTIRKVVRLEPAEHRAQVKAAKGAGKTWSNWIRGLADREIAGLSTAATAADTPEILAGSRLPADMESTP